MRDAGSPTLAEGSSTDFAAENEDGLAAPRMNADAERGVSPQNASPPRRGPRSAFRSWMEIRSRIRAATHWAFLLDFDGTLVNLRRRPGEVRMSARSKSVLENLVRHPNVAVAIVSGRTLRTLQRLVDVEGLQHFGLQGAQRAGKSTAVSKKSRRTLEHVKRAARLNLGDTPGIWIEDKGLSFAVHHRDANASVSEAAGAGLADLVTRWGDALHILNGHRVWEVLPREIAGKSSAVDHVLSALPASTAVAYFGDDETDEKAFAVLPDQITVRVGREPHTRARYYVRTPADVLLLLARMEKELP